MYQLKQRFDFSTITCSLAISTFLYRLSCLPACSTSLPPFLFPLLSLQPKFYFYSRFSSWFLTTTISYDRIHITNLIVTVTISRILYSSFAFYLFSQCVCDYKYYFQILSLFLSVQVYVCVRERENNIHMCSLLSPCPPVILFTVEKTTC